MTDNQNTPLTLWNSTVKLSCQYPLAGVDDLTQENEKNIQNNTWEVVKDRLSCVGEVGCEDRYDCLLYTSAAADE